MLKPKQQLTHKRLEANKFALEIPKTVSKSVFRVDSKGDAHINTINTAYDKLVKVFTKIEAELDKGIKEKGYASENLKKELKDARKRVRTQITKCKEKKKMLNSDYNTTVALKQAIDAYMSSGYMSSK